MKPEEIRQESELVTAGILKSHLFQSAEHILCYYPLGSEVNILPVAQQGIQLGKKIAFPKVMGEDMEFIRVPDMECFAEGAFHIMEPIGERIVNWEDALVLTPGLAFDRQGGRIGYGRGYYDRYFAKHPGLIRAGVAYNRQIVEQVPMDSLDQNMQYLFDETGEQACR